MSVDISHDPLGAGVNLAHANVLIIEDEPLMSALLSRYIKQLESQNADTKFNFCIRSDGWELLQEDLSHVKVAIVDILLPKVTGVDLIRDFRKRYPSMGLLPISGMATEPYKRKLNELLPPGFHLIDKPLRPEVFREAFIKALHYRPEPRLHDSKPSTSHDGDSEPLWTAVEPTNSTVSVNTMRRKLLRKKTC